MFVVTAIPALKDNYIWLIHKIGCDFAAVVDPGEAAPVLMALKNLDLRLTDILLTHHHWDHTQGVSELKQLYSLRVFGPATENISELTHPVREGDTVKLDSLDLNFNVLDIPGHTSGHIAYYGYNKLFCGDTLFTGGCGKIFEGTTEQFYTSLQKLAALPALTEIYCGHEYTENNLRFANCVEPSNSELQQRLEKVRVQRKANIATVPALLRLEKQTNPFLRCDHPDVIAAACKHVNKNLATSVEVFSAIREWKNHFN